MESKESFQEHYNSRSQPAKSDADAEADMKDRERSDDPMLAYFREKDRDKVGVKGKPVYKGPCPPNRYNIRPGYRWDGVDRSNGHEKKLMETQNTKKASEEESHRDATRDL